MNVMLRRPWWNHHEGVLYPQSLDGINIPDKYRDILPSTATLLSADEASTKQRRTKKKKDDAAAAEPDTFSALSKLQPDLSGV